MRVLIIKISSMGDILQTLPSLTDAMQIIPNIVFDWVVEEDFIQIPSWHPTVDKVIPVAFRRWLKYFFNNDHRKEWLKFNYTLQLNKYDMVIDAQGLIKTSILVTRLAKGCKHGQDSKSAREFLSSWWCDKTYAINKEQHAVERTRELFAKSLGYTKPPNPGDYGMSKLCISPLPYDKYKYLIFIHSTTSHNKHWPELYWRELIKNINPNILRIKLPWGTQKELQRALRLAEKFHHVEILPQLTIQELAQQIHGAHAVVSVDTGLSHLTAALNRPNITLFGPTKPKKIGGYGKNQISLISSTNSLKDLKVDEVLSQLTSLISEKQK